MADSFEIIIFIINLLKLMLTLPLTYVSYLYQFYSWLWIQSA